MKGSTAKQKTSFIKKKAGPQLGYRTPEFFKVKKFGGQGTMQKFNASQFRTQHKGG
ncbi:MAG: hypothetical protein ABIJ85_03490 [bacterium]